MTVTAIILYALLTLWTLPQSVLGALCFIIQKIRGKRHEHYSGWAPVWVRTDTFCFSLGLFVFTPENATPSVKMHENGHSIQSAMLGPLYLLAVGIPSVCRFWYKRWASKSYVWYHSGYPENWADRLGGVNDRKE